MNITFCLSDFLQKSDFLIFSPVPFVAAESDFEGFLEIESQGFITFIHERLAHIRKPFSIILGIEMEKSSCIGDSLYLFGFWCMTIWLYQLSLNYRKLNFKLHSTYMRENEEEGRHSYIPF